MTDYLTHPLNKRAHPNLTDMFDNGRLDKNRGPQQYKTGGIKCPEPPSDQ